MVTKSTTKFSKFFETLPTDLNNNNARLHFPNEKCYFNYIKEVRLYKSQSCLQYENNEHS